MADHLQVFIASYRSSNKKSCLAYLEALSEKRQDGGLLHGGHIHYIQGRTEAITLKAAISEVLDRVPHIFPLDWPEIVAKNPDYEPPENIKKAFQEINAELLLPIDGMTIVEIIKLAREYAAEDSN